MSVAAKLTAIAENQQKVFEAGKQAEYDRFWDKFQNYGRTENYNYAFAMGRFNDENYNPKYPIKCSSGNTSGRYMFYNASDITDTKVEIIPYNDLSNAFANSGIVTIRKLTVHEGISYSATFTETNDLVNITFEGEIGQDISFRYCSKLSDKSVDNIIEHLKDFTGATGKKLTVPTVVYNRIVSSGKDALISAKEWTLAKG
jgi:hypothetical protein